MILFLLKLLKRKKKAKKTSYRFLNEKVDPYKLVKFELNKKKIDPKNFSDWELELLISDILILNSIFLQYDATKLFADRYRKEYKKNKLTNTNMKTIRKVKISGYNRKANKVKEHFRRLDEFHQLNDGGQGVIDVINAIGSAKPEVKTTLAIDEQTGTILKNIGYTLAGAIVLGAVIRLKAK
jgi:hypothetical protein